MSVQKKFGGELSEEEFRKFTLYTTQSCNPEDDHSRAQILGFINDQVRIAFGALVRIGDNQIGKGSYIGIYSYVNGDVKIGENVLIAPHVSIVSSNHVYSPIDDCFSGRSDIKKGRVIIEDGAWLTSGVVVTPGVTIGRCSLVCANSVVTADVEAYAIVGGAPAVQLGKIDRETGKYIWFAKEQ